MAWRGARRRGLGVEGLEQRSMLAADAGDPTAGADGPDDLCAVETVQPAMVEHCIVVDPCIAVNACVVVDPCLVDDIPSTIDPGILSNGLDPEIVIITDPVVDPLVWLVALDLPVLIDEEPVVIVCPGIGDPGELSDVTFLREDGIDGAATTSVEAVVDDPVDAVPVADLLEPVPAVANDDASETPVAGTASGDDSVLAEFVAASAAAAPASATVAAVDTARLFAAYAAGFGQAGADTPVGQSIGGRRGGRR
jgi:hypothetical protein